MPEGDTIHRTAIRLRPALVGATVVAFQAPRLRGQAPRVGEQVESVDAVGKHLLIAFSGGLTLRTHMRMTGHWHLRRPDERRKRRDQPPRVTIEVDRGWVADCFAAPVIETFRTEVGSDAVARLGPDLSMPDPDLDEVLARVAAQPADREVAEVLLDQHIAGGIGNVYKSDTLFLCRTHPFAPIGSVDVDTRHRLFATAHRLLRANLGRSQRVTYQGGLAVYGRQRQPCKRCGTVIRVVSQGPLARPTYWCPTCQPAPPGVDPEYPSSTVGSSP